MLYIMYNVKRLAWIIGENLRNNVRLVYTDPGQKIDKLIPA